MTTIAPTVKPTAAKRVPMTSLRKSSLAAGVLYLITFVSIPSIALYSAVRKPEFILGAGPDTPVLIGGILEIIVALAGIGTGVALYPVLKRRNQSLAMGFVGIRVLEAATIFSGIASLLSVVTLRQTGAGTQALATAQGLIAQHDWTFTLGQGTMPAINDLLLGILLYKSGMVPRILPLLALIGAPILIASVTAKYFGVYSEISLWSGLAALPVAVFELSIGVYLTVKGFKPSRTTAEMAAAGNSPTHRDVTV